MVKRCTKCKIIKNESEFSKDKRIKNGLGSWCKNCIKNSTKKWRLANSEYDNKYYKNNKEEISNQRKQHYKENKKRILDRNKKYIRERLNTDPVFRLKRNLYRRVNNFVKGKDKSIKTIDLLGCTVKELRSHLESKFTKGMSWNNYGEWHVDHIFPCASFDLRKSEEQRKCFYYTNLQPLWAADNFKKSNWIGGINEQSSFVKQ